MSKPQIRAEQLQRGYKAPVTEVGKRINNADGSLVTTASFTTSAKRQERRAELRPDNTANSTGFATSVTSTEPPNQVSNLVQNRTPAGIQPPGGNLRYERPFSLKTDQEKEEARRVQSLDPSLAPTTHRPRQTRANAQGWNYSIHSEPPKNAGPTEPSSSLSDRQKQQLKGR